MAKRNPWVEPDPISDEEMERLIAEFLANGGEIINTEHYSEKKNSPSAVKIGSTHRKLRRAKQRSQKKNR